VKQDAAAATAAQKQAYAAEAAAAGAAAAKSSSSSNAANRKGSAASEGTGFWGGSSFSRAEGAAASNASANISIASWIAGYDNGSSITAGPASSQDQQQQLSSATQLLPIVLHTWVAALGQQGRLQQLQANELVLAAASVAGLQQQVPAGWMDR
jgi:hypothetical protein